MGGFRKSSEPTVFVTRDFPLGTIQLYSGAIANIPGTWRLCDGTLGTPDLRDKFIVGAGSAYAVDAIGGAVQHEHMFTGFGHAHGIGAGLKIAAGANKNWATNDVMSTGKLSNANGLSPYYSLAYIMYAGKVH